ncbi:MAG: hypothetical protein ACI35U_03840 [Marinilabiliaceae bacterium]|nr:hypothetical protein [Bacteroidales bacterium]
MEEKKLIPLVGFGKVRFGMSVDQVEKILGKADEKNVDVRFGEEPDDIATELVYDKLGLSLSFDKLYKYRLTDIMTEEGSQFGLDGIIKLGDAKDKVLAAALEKDYGPYEEADLTEEAEDEDEIREIEEEGLEEIDFEDMGLNLWFSKGVLSTIQLGPEFDEHDSPIWPEA